MHIGLFGGSFNPPHHGHLIVAEWIRDAAGLDEVWWVPARVPPHKAEERLASAEHRLAMTRLAIQGNRYFKVEPLEIERDGRSFTVETLDILTRRHDQARFSLIIGEDSLRAFASWKEPRRILEMAGLLVYPRGTESSSSPPQWIGDALTHVPAPVLEISGTGIRRRHLEGRSIRYLVPETVWTYIQAHDLYREAES